MTNSKRSVQVALGEKLIPVGQLVFQTDGRRELSSFRYDDAWLNHPDRFAISPSLKLVDTPYFAAGTRENTRLALPYPIADAAPDAWGRGIIANTLGGAATELDYLLAADDTSRQGALRFLDEKGVPLADTHPPIPRLNDLDNLRELARSFEQDPEAAKKAADKLIGFAGSLGGARPKSSLDDAGVLSIAKFTSENDTMPIERVEVAALQLASLAGITTPNVRLELTSTDRPVAIIQRFDRRGTARIPYLSGQSFTDIDARQGGYYTDIADALRAHAESPARQIHELYRRVLFTILVSNNDDHLKNHGFLYSGGDKWILAPVFDVNPQPERHRHLETGISEISGNEASIEAAVEAAAFFDLSKDGAVTILREVVEAVDANWQQLLDQAGLSSKDIKIYQPAFQHRETELARKLVQVPSRRSRRAGGLK